MKFKMMMTFLIAFCVGCSGDSAQKDTQHSHEGPTHDKRVNALISAVENAPRVNVQVKKADRSGKLLSGGESVKKSENFDLASILQEK